MSSDQVRALRETALADPGIVERFSHAASVEEAVIVAADLGYHVTAEELIAAAHDLQPGELSESDLADVSGAGVDGTSEFRPASYA